MRRGTAVGGWQLKLGRLLVYAAAIVSLAPAPARAQVSDPCAAMCGATLVGMGVVAATGTTVLTGRLTGGFSTTSAGLLTWGTSFAAVVGSGVALSGDGERQERAIYSAALGSAVAATLALGITVLTEDDDGTRRLAATLVGATAGVLIGGVYGALSHDERVGSGYASMSINVGF